MSSPDFVTCAAGLAFHAVQKGKDATTAGAHRELVLQAAISFPAMHGILDKQHIIAKAVDECESLDGSDNAILSWAQPHIEALTEGEKTSVIDFIIIVASSDDDMIDAHEYDFIAGMARHVGIADVTSSSIVARAKALRLEQAKSATSIKPEKGMSRRGLIAAGAAGLAVGGGGLAIVRPSNIAKIFGSHGARENLSGTVTFLTIDFEKYIVAGNLAWDAAKNGVADQATKHLQKAAIFHLKGKALVNYDLSGISIKRHFNGDAELTLTNKRAPAGIFESAQPFFVEVTYPQSGLTHVDDLKPAPLSSTEAKALGAAIGVIAGVGTGWIAGKLAATAASAAGNMAAPAKFFSMAAGKLLPAIGALAGGAAGGTAGFVAGEKYLTGLQLSDAMTQGDKEAIVTASVQMIAAEILENNRLMEIMRKRAISHAEALAKSLGIQNITSSAIA